MTMFGNDPLGLGRVDNDLGKLGDEIFFKTLGQPAAPKSGDSPSQQKLPSESKGVGSVVEGLFQTVFGRDGSTKGQNSAGLGQFGDFNLDQYLESNLAKARGDDADGVASTIGGLIKLIGL